MNPYFLFAQHLRNSKPATNWKDVFTYQGENIVVHQAILYRYICKSTYILVKAGCFNQFQLPVLLISRSGNQPVVGTWEINRRLLTRPALINDFVAGMFNS